MVTSHTRGIFTDCFWPQTTGHKGYLSDVKLICSPQANDVIVWYGHLPAVNHPRWLVIGCNKQSEPCYIKAQEANVSLPIQYGHPRAPTTPFEYRYQHQLRTWPVQIPRAGWSTISQWTHADNCTLFQRIFRWISKVKQSRLWFNHKEMPKWDSPSNKTSSSGSPRWTKGHSGRSTWYHG